MKKEFSIYKMENNKYMGNCICVECKLAEVPEGFTGNDITILIKADDDVWERSNTLEELTSSDIFGANIPYLRFGSECMLGVMGDSHCNCEEERIEALTKIGKNRGVYFHMPQEAQGMGLFYKAKELHLQVHGYMPNGKFVGCKSQAEAARLLTGNKIIDSREYDIISEIMKDLGLDKYSYVFMSRNPNKVKSLKNAGIEVVKMYDINTHMDANNLGEYLTKWIDKGYCFTEDEVTQLIDIISVGSNIPKRATDLLSKAADMFGTTEGRAYLEKHLYGAEDKKQALYNLIVYNYKVAQAV